MLKLQISNIQTSDICPSSCNLLQLNLWSAKIHLNLWKEWIVTIALFQWLATFESESGNSKFPIDFGTKHMIYNFLIISSECYINWRNIIDAEQTYILQNSWNFHFFDQRCSNLIQLGETFEKWYRQLSVLFSFHDETKSITNTFDTFFAVLLFYGYIKFVFQ